MLQKQDLEDAIISTETAKSMTETFEEVSAVRMKAIRASVAQTRAFLAEVDTVFQEVKVAYTLWAKRHAGGNHGLTINSSVPKNGKIVYVLLSANSGLYGDLPMRVTRQFISEVGAARKNSSKPIEVVAVGRVGQYLLEHNTQPIKCTGFSLSDDRPSDSEVSPIVDILVRYDQIYVTYAHFVSLLSLVPETVDISGGNPEAAAAELEAKLAVHDEHMIYEPSVVEIAQFFETEILKSLFWQKVYEMQLSRFASRMVAMDAATQQSNDVLAHLKADQAKMVKRIGNQKLQELFAGSLIW